MENDTLVHLLEVVSWHPHRVCKSTVYNWCTRGVISKSSGERVYLERVPVAGVWFTTRKYYEKFIKESGGKV